MIGQPNGLPPSHSCWELWDTVYFLSPIYFLSLLYISSPSCIFSLPPVYFLFLIYFLSLLYISSPSYIFPLPPVYTILWDTVLIIIAVITKLSSLHWLYTAVLHSCSLLLPASPHCPRCNTHCRSAILWDIRPSLMSLI